MGHCHSLPAQSGSLQSPLSIVTGVTWENIQDQVPPLLEALPWLCVSKRRLSELPSPHFASPPTTFTTLTPTSPAGLVLLLHTPGTMLLLFPLSLECSSWLTLSPPQVLADMLPPYWSFTQFPSSKVDPNSYSLWFLPCFLLLHSTSQILHVFSYSFYVPSLSSVNMAYQGQEFDWVLPAIYSHRTVPGM